MKVESAIFRVAQPQEVAQSKGGYFWQAISYPWNFLNKILGTVEMISKGPDIISWQIPLPLRAIKWLTFKTGLSPHNGFIRTFPTFFFETHQLVDEKVVKAFFKTHRNSEVFKHSRTFELLFDVFKKTFPEMQFDYGDFIFTCNSGNTRLYHHLFAAAIKEENVKSIIDEEVREALSEWAESSIGHQFVNVTAETRVLASRIIIRVLLGQKVNDTQLCDSINYVNLYIQKLFSKSTIAKDEELLNRALANFKKLTNELLEKEIPLFADEQLSDAQKRALVFVTFFAGQETVASLLTYILYQAAADDNFLQMPVKDVFIKAIHDFTPAYGVARALRTDACLEYKLEGETVTRKVILYKGQQVAARMMQLAEKIPLPQEGYTAWSPFGGGPHSCPGRYLAEYEVKTVISKLKEGYNLRVSPNMITPKKIGLVTLQLSEDVYIHFEKSK